MFDWMAALFAFFSVMALVTFVWMISVIAVWIEKKLGFTAGLFAVFVSVAIMFALIVGVSAI